MTAILTRSTRSSPFRHCSKSAVQLLFVSQGLPNFTVLLQAHTYTSVPCLLDFVQSSALYGGGKVGRRALLTEDQSNFGLQRLCEYTLAMDSPRSTTSSSDLYSNSDSANYRAQPHPAQNGLAPRQVSQSLPEDPMSESIGSRRSNTSQTIRGYRGRSLSRSRGGSTSLAAVSDGNLPDTSHKRKRDHDPYPVGYASSYQISPDVDHTIAGSSSADTSTSVKCTISAKDDWLRNKRSKTDEYSVGSTGTLPNSSPSSVLPAELWQYIFCFVPPVSLGRLLRVSSAFNAFLILEKTDESHPGLYHRSVVKPMTAHSVWAASRKRFCPGLPKPLRGLQELDMWRLLRGRNCQMCGEIMAPSLEIPSESPWESGPGEKGVRVIWPFGIRCCGRCLQKNTEKVSPHHCNHAGGIAILTS